MFRFQKRPRGIIEACNRSNALLISLVGNQATLLLSTTTNTIPARSNAAPTTGDHSKEWFCSFVYFNGTNINDLILRYIVKAGICNQLVHADYNQ